MNIKFKLTLFFLFGFFFFWITGPILTGKMRSFHERNNTKIIEKAPWIFTFFNGFFKAGAFMCLIYIIMIWTGIVTLPTE